MRRLIWEYFCEVRSRLRIVKWGHSMLLGRIRSRNRRERKKRRSQIYRN